MLYSNFEQELVYAFGNVGIMRSWEEYDAYQTEWLRNLPEAYIIPTFRIMQNPVTVGILAHFDQTELLFALEQVVGALAKSYPAQVNTQLAKIFDAKEKTTSYVIAISALGAIPAKWAEPYIEKLICSKQMTCEEYIVLIGALCESDSLHKLEYLKQLEIDNKFSRYTNTEREAIQHEINIVRERIAN